MKRLIASLLLSLTGGARVQRFLERNVARSLRLMGVGAGAEPHASGEWALVEELKRRHAQHGQPLTLFDVGANKGQFLWMALRLLQGRGIPFHVHAFEPGEEAFRVLRERFGEHPHVSLNHLALGSESGEAELFYDQAGSGLASLSRRKLDHFGIRFDHSERVPIETLERYCARRGVPAIDLLKLDVEGHELDVLRGASALFRERRIRMASFEFGGANVDTRTYLRDFWEFFEEHGMGPLHRILPSGRLAPLRGYSEADEHFRTTNFVAFQAGVRGESP